MKQVKCVFFGAGGVGLSALIVQYVQGQFVEKYDPTIEDSYRKEIKLNGNNRVILDILDTAGQEEFSTMWPQATRNEDVFIVVFCLTCRSTLDAAAEHIVRIRFTKALALKSSDLFSKNKLNKRLMETHDIVVGVSNRIYKFSLGGFCDELKSSYKYNRHLFENDEYLNKIAKVKVVNKEIGGREKITEFSALILKYNECCCHTDAIPIILVGNKIDLEHNISAEEIKKFIKDFDIKHYIETSAKTNENVEELFKTIAELGLNLQTEKESIKKKGRMRRIFTKSKPSPNPLQTQSPVLESTNASSVNSNTQTTINSSNDSHQPKEDNAMLTPEQEHEFLQAVEHGNLETVKKLLAAGANPEARKENRWGEGLHPTALLLICGKHANTDQHLEIAKLLIAAGAKVSTALNEKQNWTPVHEACKHNNTRLLNFLISYDANLQAIYKGRQTYVSQPIHEAAIYNGIDALEILLKHNVDINAVMNNGNTALHIAAKKNNLHLVKLLLQNNANITLQNNDGKTPLFLAVENNNIDIIRELLNNALAKTTINMQAKSSETPLFKAVANGNLEIAKILIEKGGADLEVANAWGSTPLSHACHWQNRKAIVELLLDHGAKLITYNKNEHGGRTPFHHAAEVNDSEILASIYAKRSKEQDFDINIRSLHHDDVGWKQKTNFNEAEDTPLHCAVRTNRAKNVEKFLAYGAKFDLKNAIGEMAIDIAIKNKNIEIIKLFLKQALKCLDQHIFIRAYTALKELNAIFTLAGDMEANQLIELLEKKYLYFAIDVKQQPVDKNLKVKIKNILQRNLQLHKMYLHGKTNTAIMSWLQDINIAELLAQSSELASCYLNSLDSIDDSQSSDEAAEEIHKTKKLPAYNYQYIPNIIKPVIIERKLLVEKCRQLPQQPLFKHKNIELNILLFELGYYFYQKYQEEEKFDHLQQAIYYWAAVESLFEIKTVPIDYYLGYSYYLKYLKITSYESPENTKNALEISAKYLEKMQHIDYVESKKMVKVVQKELEKLALLERKRSSKLKRLRDQIKKTDKVLYQNERRFFKPLQTTFANFTKEIDFDFNS